MSRKSRATLLDEACPHCKGTGRLASPSREAASRKGGNAAYLASLKPGAKTMAERGRLGGAPRLPRAGDAGISTPTPASPRPHAASTEATS